MVINSATRIEWNGNGSGRRVARVTGAHQGIRRAIAIALAKAGVNVASNYLDDATAAEAVVAERHKSDRRAVLFQGGVASIAA